MKHDKVREVTFIKKALKAHPVITLNALLKLHPAEIADIFLEFSKEERISIAHLFPLGDLAQVLVKLSNYIDTTEILLSFSLEEQSKILIYLEYDDAVSIISTLDSQHQTTLLNTFSLEIRTQLNILLSYQEDSAGRLMNTKMISIRQDIKKKEALSEVINQSEEKQEVLTIFVVDKENILTGTLSLKELIIAEQNTQVSAIMDRDIKWVKGDDNQEKVAKAISQYDLSAIAVVDNERKLIGNIAVDDIIDVLEKENTEDILKIAGVSEAAGITDSWKNGVTSRLPWLLINLFTAFAASFIIRNFEPIISSFVILSAYMTIIAGVGGNAATQTLAVTVRRIAINEISNKQALKIMWRELAIGLINGMVVGILVFVITYFLEQNLYLGLVIFIAMAGNVILACFTGYSIPIFLQKINIDPAVASSIIITTFTDSFGFLLLLGLASLILL